MPRFRERTRRLSIRRLPHSGRKEGRHMQRQRYFISQIKRFTGNSAASRFERIPHRFRSALFA
jgi:hypothetical protein